MTREGEEEGSLVSSSPLPLPLPPFFFFAPDLTFAQLLDWKRSLRRLHFPAKSDAGSHAHTA